MNCRLETGLCEWVRNLLHTHEELSSDSQNPHKGGTVPVSVTPALLSNKGGGENLQSYQATLVHTVVNRDTVSNKVEREAQVVFPTLANMLQPVTKGGKSHRILLKYPHKMKWLSRDTH